MLPSSPRSRSTSTSRATWRSTSASDSSARWLRSSMRAIAFVRQRGAVAQEAGLVGQVLLVERGRARRGRAFERPGISRRRRAWRVGCVEGDDEEQRAVGAVGRPDRPDREVAEHGRLVVLGLRAALGDLPVLVQLIVEGVVGGRLEQPVPVPPARRDLGGLAEAVAVQVLADIGRPVADLLQPDAERLLVVERVEAVGPAVGDHACVVGVLAGKEGGPRGAAERVGDVVALELHALGADQLARLGQRAHLLERLVVGHHDDDVRLRRRRLRVGPVVGSHRACGEGRTPRPRRRRGTGGRARRRGRSATAGWVAPARTPAAR